MTTSRPLVTFAMFAYNQERFIREAVEGALAQTYEPLEIIISDDCSTDRTFEIVREMADAYAGPHRIVLNRNEVNRGLALSINRVMEMATGEFVVISAGDDVSLASRTDELYNAWESTRRADTCVYSDMDLIDSDSRLVRSAPCHSDYSGLRLEGFLERPISLICTYAFTRDLAVRFPPLHAPLRNEDFIFPFRALLRGNRLVYLPQSLVKYRIGVGVSAQRKIDRPAEWLPDFIREKAMLQQLEIDLASVADAPEWATAKLDRLIQHNAWALKLAQESSEMRAARGLVRRMVESPRGMVNSLRTFLRVRHPQLTAQLRRLRYAAR